MAQTSSSSGSGSGAASSSGSGSMLLQDFGVFRNPTPTDEKVPKLGEQPANVIYGATLHPFDDDTLKTPVSLLSLTEVGNGGWAGEVLIVPPPSLTATVEDAFSGAFIMEVAPGQGTMLRLLRSTKPNEVTVLRTWPSVVMGLQTLRGTQEYTPAYRAQLADPLTLISTQRIWGVFVDESIGRILGGAISLAMGGDGIATLTPTTGRTLPTIEIEPNVRDELESIPLAIAAGAEFGDWLQDLTAELGVRVQLRTNGRKVIVDVLDAPPEGDAVDMALAANIGGIDENNAALTAMGAQARSGGRASLLDNRIVGDAERSNPIGSVGQVIDAMYTEGDEAWLRAGFANDNDFLDASSVTITSQQSKLEPGARVAFDEQVFGSQDWQVAVSLHRFTTGLYRNIAKLQKGGVAWRGEGGRLDDGITVTAVVDDGASDPGEPVGRDRLGRIPVRLSFLKGGEGESWVDEAEWEIEARAWTGAPVALPVLETMGSGGAHGFVSAHRQGDPCRVVIHSPLNAEIVGFVYRHDGRVGADLTDSTGGLVVRHETDGFSGLVFRPDEDLDAELAAELEGQGDSSGSGDGDGS